MTRAEAISPAVVAGLGRDALLDRYQRNRARSRALFDLIDPSAYYSRPIALRNPIVFYEGHLPAFSIIALLNRGFGLRGVDERLERLFARGIDPESQEAAVPRSGASTIWPSRQEVLAFAAAADEAIVEALSRVPFDADRSSRRHAEAIYTALEHEEMHQETLLYMWRRAAKHRTTTRATAEHGRTQTDTRHGRTQQNTDTEPSGILPPLTYERGGAPPSYERVMVPAGMATLGARRDHVVFGWDNEFEAHQVHVAAFDIDVYNVTNADYLAFVDAGGYRNRRLWSDTDWEWVQAENVEYPAFWRRREDAWLWRGMFEDIPLPPAWPVYVSHAEATAYARWKGRRLPTEAEYHRAAYGMPSGLEREFPWPSGEPDTTRGNFDFQNWEPVPVGSRPAGASAWGLHDLVGNGWEWTSTIFAPFHGFEPMSSYPEYSADFFDGQHYVLKGASPGTAKELLRRSLRNWFRPNYPYVYATFRTVA